MGGLLNAVKGLIGGSSGKGAAGQQDKAPGAGGDQNDKSSDDRLQYVQDRWNDLKNAYIVYHQAIWQSFLFYANQSWIDWDDARKVWYPLTPSDDWVPRPRINRFSPTIDAVASNIYKIPEVEATPKPSDDPTAVMVADIATRLADHLLIDQGLRRQKDNQPDKAGVAAQQFVLSGGVFTIWNVRKKSMGQSPVRTPQQTFGYTCQNCDTYEQLPVGQDPPKFCPECGQPVVSEPVETVAQASDEQGNPQMQDNSEYKLELEIGNNLWAFPRAGAGSMDDTPFLVWAQRDTLDAIFFKYDNFEAEADAIWPDGYSVTYEHAMNFWYTGYSSSTMQVKDSCMVLRMFVEPGKVKDHPDGFYGVVINDKLAHEEDWNFPCHPVSQIKYLDMPTIFFARSIGFDLVELQRELNAYESVIKLHAMVAAVDPIVVDANTVVSEITGRSDKVIKWRSIGPNSEPPHRMGSGHLDDGVYKQRDSLHAEFQNVSMAVNAFRGQQEGSINAASAISQLRQQAELMFNKPVANWNNGWCETVRKGVKFMQFYYSLEQLAAIVGPGREQELQMFKNADLDSVTEWAASASGIPKTRDERRQELMTLWDKGALDMSQPSVRKQVYELFGETGMMQAFNKDATNARLENVAIKNGAGWMGPGNTIPAPGQMIPDKPIPGPDGQIHPAIQPMVGIEDLAVHYYFHVDQIKSQDFKKWPPPAQTALIQHTLMTKQAMMMEAMQQATIAAAAHPPKPGLGPGGAGRPGGPPRLGAGPQGNSTQAAVNGQSGAAAAQGAGAGGNSEGPGQ